MSNSETISVVLLVITLGWIALMLVSTELGRRIGLKGGGRLFLTAGLGLGIIALTIKAGVLLYLSALSAEGMQALHEATGGTAKFDPRPAAIEQVPLEVARNGKWSSWQALPVAWTLGSKGDEPKLKARQALGRTLFFDKNLSLDRTLSCASCHDLPTGGDDNASTSTGYLGQKGDRNAPTVLNAVFLDRHFWDGRARGLADQARQPLINPIEMAMPDWRAVEARVAENPAYKAAFEAAFGKGSAMTIDRIADAIASYEALLITPSSPYDRFIHGENDAMSIQQLRGMALFDELGCRTCHIDPTFSSAGLIKPLGTFRQFPVFPDNAYIAKYDLLLDGKSGSWRVPSLRNVARTGPYFHNGSVSELKEAIRIMAVSQLGRIISNDPADDLKISSVPVGDKEDRRRLTILKDQALDDQDVADLEAFLKALSGDLPPELMPPENEPPENQTAKSQSSESQSSESQAPKL